MLIIMIQERGVFVIPTNQAILVAEVCLTSRSSSSCYSVFKVSETDSCLSPSFTNTTL